MFQDLSRARAIGAWCTLVVVIGAFGVAAGAAISIGNGGLLLVTCLIPSAVMLLVWRGAPPLTVAELLYDVNKPSKEGRRS
jgi:hypothetical protein